MSFTAIVLTPDSCTLAAEVAGRYGIAPIQWDLKLHHVTLAMGEPSGFKIGEERVLTVTHAGRVEGRVTAFKVAGAGDSVNKVPHVTIAVSKGAKPVESNQIVDWREIEPFTIRGKVEVCC